MFRLLRFFPEFGRALQRSAKVNTCCFCSIIEGIGPASILLSAESELAFLDISQVNPGHTLVVPRRHVESLTQLSREEVCSLTLAVQHIAALLKSRVPGCVGITLSLADGEGAGQEVPHVHFHVIPRFLSDDFGWRRYGKKTDRANLDALAARLTASA